MIGKAKRKTKILINPNKYKDTFEDIVDSLDIEPSNGPKPIDKR